MWWEPVQRTNSFFADTVKNDITLREDGETELDPILTVVGKLQFYLLVCFTLSIKSFTDTELNDAKAAMKRHHKKQDDQIRAEEIAYLKGLFVHAWSCIASVFFPIGTTSGSEPQHDSESSSSPHNERLGRHEETASELIPKPSEKWDIVTSGGGVIRHRGRGLKDGYSEITQEHAEEGYM
jgi:hypothetical protein